MDWLEEDTGSKRSTSWGANIMIRDIVRIDEDKCDGCGVCAPACLEGAIQIVNGKARLVDDRFCDGLGTCLGHCPQGAIRIEKRHAEVFDEQAVQAQLQRLRHRPVPPPVPHGASQEATTCVRPAAVPAAAGRSADCPSTQFARLDRPSQPSPATQTGAGESLPLQRSELTHWPIQLRLLPSQAPILRGASLLLSADCVPFAFAEFHRQLLHGRAVLIACPKLDDTSSYLSKLTEMIQANDLADITVVHMEVPCCTGMLNMIVEARRLSGKQVPIEDLVMSTRGEMLSRRQI